MKLKLKLLSSAMALACLAACGGGGGSSGGITPPSGGGGNGDGGGGGGSGGGGGTSPDDGALSGGAAASAGGDAGSTADVGYAYEGAWRYGGGLILFSHGKAIMTSNILTSGADASLGYAEFTFTGKDVLGFDQCTFIGNQVLNAGSVFGESGRCSGAKPKDVVYLSGTTVMISSWNYDLQTNRLAVNADSIVGHWRNNYNNLVLDVAADGSITGSTAPVYASTPMSGYGTCQFSGHIEMDQPGTKKNLYRISLDVVPGSVCAITNREGAPLFSGKSFNGLATIYVSGVQNSQSLAFLTYTDDNFSFVGSAARN